VDKVDNILNQLGTYPHKMTNHTWTWLMGLTQEEWTLALVAGTSLGLSFLIFGCGNKR
jgi:hypothetical protein